MIIQVRRIKKSRSDDSKEHYIKEKLRSKTSLCCKEKGMKKNGLLICLQKGWRFKDCKTNGPWYFLEASDWSLLSLRGF